MWWSVQLLAAFNDLLHLIVEALINNWILTLFWLLSSHSGICINQLLETSIFNSPVQTVNVFTNLLLFSYSIWGLNYT